MSPYRARYVARSNGSSRSYPSNCDSTPWWNGTWRWWRRAPSGELRRVDAEPVGHVRSELVGEELLQLDGAGSSHDTMTLVYALSVTPRRCRPGVAVVELVRPDHPGDPVSADRFVPRRQRREEPGHLEDQLGAPGRQKVAVSGDLPVLPGLVGDRQPDVALEPRTVGHPPSRAGIEQPPRRLVPAVAPALPGEHRYRGVRPRRPPAEPPAGGDCDKQRAPPTPRGCGAREREKANSVSQNTWPRYPSPCRPREPDARIELDEVGRRHLEHVEEVEVEHRRPSPSRLGP